MEGLEVEGLEVKDGRWRGWRWRTGGGGAGGGGREDERTRGQLERTRGREEERTREQEDERTRGREDETTREQEDERTRRRENKRTRGRDDERTRGREDERTREQENERTRGREDERTREPTRCFILGIKHLFPNFQVKSPFLCRLKSSKHHNMSKVFLMITTLQFTQSLTPDWQSVLCLCMNEICSSQVPGSAVGFVYSSLSWWIKAS